MRILCGLGNPGKKYENTRHNVGFMFIDELAKQNDFPEFQEKWDALVSEGNWQGERTLLIKPLTFMNLSGKALAKFANFYKVEAEDIWSIYDDIDLKLGTTRIRKSGGAGTHNGMKSIIQELGTESFPRLRIGIESRGTHAPEQMDISAFVLAPFSEEEIKEINAAIQTGMGDLKNALA